jgi:cytochrome c6
MDLFSKEKRMKKAAAVLMLLFVVAMVLVPTSFAAADEGKKIFETKCAVCHGADGAGKVKGTPDLRSAAIQSKSDAELEKFIAEGKGHGFAKKGLTEAQIKDVVAHIRTLKK